MISTAEAQSRKKATNFLTNHHNKVNSKLGVNGGDSSIGKMSHGKVKISHLLEETKIGSKETMPHKKWGCYEQQHRQVQLQQYRTKNNEDLRQMGMDDINRWNASMEEQSRELLLNGSDPQAIGEGVQQQNTCGDEILRVEENSTPKQPQHTFENYQKRSQSKDDCVVGGGAMVAAPSGSTRRNIMMSKKQRGSFSKTKVPINLLPVRGGKVLDQNPDLLIISPQNRHETETMDTEKL